MTAGRSRRPSPRRSPVPVALVSMPFKDLHNPPIQLGILQQALALAGVRSRAHALELTFMEHLRAATGSGQDSLSVRDYQDVAHEHFAVRLGDWIFKVPPYADLTAGDEEYLAYARGEGTPEPAIGAARRMREAVPRFLQTAVRRILADKPRVVGFSTVFQQNVASLVLAKMLKQADASLVIVFGGDNCDGVMGAALHRAFPWIDLVVRGEGERVLVHIVEDVLADRPVRPQPGLCYRVDGESRAVPPDDRPQLPMNDVPSPAYDDFFAQLAKSPLAAEVRPEMAILFESSRGCWWGAKSHCTFCGLNPATMPFRSKSAARVAAEIMELAKRHKVLKFVAVDDIIDLAHVRDLLPMLRDARCDFDIYYETKANLTKEQLQAFRAAGIRRMQPGIESLSTPILRLMRKGVTALQNIRLLKWCAEVGITPDWNLLTGFPGEPPDEYARMAQLVPSLVHLQAPTCSPIALQRFSPYFENPAEFGLELTGPLPHYRFLYPDAGPMLADLAYDYGHRHADGRDPASYTGELRNEAERWQATTATGYGSLTLLRGPGFVKVRDRRPGLDAADYQFEETEAAIYLACDAGATAEAVRQRLVTANGHAPDLEEVEEFLGELVDLRLVYREDDRFLSLAIGSGTHGDVPGRAR